MTFFTASFETVLLRYFLMMVIIVGSFLIGYPILALLSLPIFILAFAAISFKNKAIKKTQHISGKDAKGIEMMNTAA